MQQFSNSRKPRIALLVPGGVAQQGRGVYIPSLYRIISSLSKEFDITVYSLVTFEPDLKSTACGDAIVHLVPSRFNDHWLKKLISLTRRLLLDHRKKPFHMVHAMLGLIPELSAVVFSALTRIPCMVSLFGGETANLPSIDYGSFRNPLLRTMTRFTVNHADLVSVLTHFQKQELAELGLRPKKLCVIPHGLDRETFFPAKKRIPYNPVRFLHVGSLTPVKDQRTLLKTFAAIVKSRPSILRIIGADYMDGALQRFAGDLGISNKVRFLGYVNHAQMLRHYQWADVLLLTSLHEGQGVVLVEAAGTKTLIAGTKVGLLWDFDDTVAVRVNVGDSEFFAAEVLRVLDNPRLMRSMVNNAFEWAIDHDISFTVRLYSETYHSMLKR